MKLIWIMISKRGKVYPVETITGEQIKEYEALGWKVQPSYLMHSPTQTSIMGDNTPPPRRLEEVTVNGPDPRD